MKLVWMTPASKQKGGTSMEAKHASLQPPIETSPPRLPPSKKRKLEPKLNFYGPFIQSSNILQHAGLSSSQTMSPTKNESNTNEDDTQLVQETLV